MAVVVLAWSHAGMADAERVSGTPLAIAIRLGGRAIAVPGVPPLGAPCADADRENPAGLELRPERAYRWVFNIRKPIRIDVRSARKPETRDVLLTVWDWDLRAVGQARIPVGVPTPVELRVEGRGTYVLTLDALGPEGAACRLVRSVSVCPSAAVRRRTWKESGFWVGQCSFPAWHAAELVPGHPTAPPGLTVEQSRALDAELVARMGVQVARINLDVRRRDEDGMDLDFTTADACVRKYVSRGLKLDIQLFPPAGPGVGPITPGHPEALPGQSPIYPMQEAPYRHFVREVARRYGKHALFFQVGNEPGNALQYRGRPDEYIEQFRQAADEVRRACPGIPVTNGGYCNDNADTQAIIRGLGRQADFASYHCHDHLKGLESFLSRVREMHSVAGADGIPLANTEMGLAMPTVGDERANAVAVMQKMLTCWAQRHEGVLLYSSRELWWPRQFSYDGVSDYGFVDYFYCPRFAYGAVSAFLDRYAGYRFDRVLQDTPELHAYAFRRGDRRLVALFSTAAPVEVALRADGPASSVIDPMGNGQDVAGQDELRVRVEDYPITVVYPEASRIAVRIHRPAKSASLSAETWPIQIVPNRLASASYRAIAASTLPSAAQRSAS